MIHSGLEELAAGCRDDGLRTGCASRLLADLGPQLRRAVESVHLRAPLVSIEELRQELVANLLLSAARGRGTTASALLKEARSRLFAWATAENHFRSLPRCVDAGEPAPSAEDAWLKSQLATAEAAAPPRRSLPATAAMTRRNPNA